MDIIDVQPTSENISALSTLVPGIRTNGLKSKWGGQLFISTKRFPFDTNNFGSSFSQHVLSDLTRLGTDEDIRERIRELQYFLKGKILVDLGAGDNPFGYEIASLCNAQGYVGVETTYSEGLIKKIVELQALGRKKGVETIPAAVVAEDFRLFVQRLPPNSVCFFVAGIDNLVLGRANQDSIDTFEGNIVKALHPEGAFISFCSDIYPKGLNTFVTHEIRKGGSDTHYEVQTKLAVTGGKFGAVYYADRPAYKKEQH